MNAPARLAGFAAVLGLAFGGAAVAGGAIDPDRGGERRRRARGRAATGEHGARAAARRPRPRRRRARPARSSSTTPELERGRTERLTFRDRRRRAAHGQRLRRRAREADAPDRRPPRPRRASSTCTPSRPPTAAGRPTSSSTSAGAYRALRRLQARGRARRRSRPTCASTAPPTSRRSPRPRRRRRATAATTSRSTATATSSRSRITRDGEPVETEPYLGAGGHLVALREGDLAFLHVHPDAASGRRVRDRVPDRGPLPPVPPVPARGPRPHRRVHQEVRAADEPRRAADHRHDVRVVREPHRAQAQQARRRHRDGQLRDRARDGRLRPRRGRARPPRRRGRGRRLPGGAADRRAGGAGEPPTSSRRCGSRMLVSLPLGARRRSALDDPGAPVRQLAVARAAARPRR